MLHTSDCPRTRPPLDELISLSRGVEDVEVESIEVRDEQTARELGCHGSPTLLVDGDDLFPYETGDAGLARRLYQGERAQRRGYPSRAQLARVIGLEITE